ncbi:MAG: ABC transporter permease [Roseitalea sp.]|nr:ABC transporter permease [Roseitalea sp.]MBO6722662.1 ABC transporter permease [Roseitalea sp.]MBO6741554.1 ABC transporter permease [Roseitalea sp.]
MGLFAFFAAWNPTAVLSTYNVRNIIGDASTLLIVAVGVTFVVATAGIDLSLGAVLIFCQVIAAKTMIAVGGSGWDATLAGTAAALLAGIAWGTLNGVMVARLRIPPLIATLGTLGMAGGTALLITNGINVRTGIPDELTLVIGAGRLFNLLPYTSVVAIVVVAAAVFALNYTRFGLHVLGIGSNEVAVERTGVNVASVKIRVYALSGACAGLGAVVDLARFSTTAVGAYSTLSLEAIAAAVIGGTSLFGGVASIIGAVIGVFIPAVLRNGFVILGVSSFWQQIAVGIILVTAVYIDQRRR